jgi:hypothetical protein
MAWYNTGTIALTNGSATVTGSGTNFLVGAQIGEALYAPDGKLYEIQTINSATVITLATTYLGSTASTQGYQIIPTQSLVADLASDVTDLISDFANVRDYAGNGKFNDGAVGTPGITFTQDQDNGLYRIGSNNWALAAGGQKIVDISTSGIDVTGSVTADGLVVDGNDSYTSNIKFDYGASAPTYFANWGYKSSSDGNKVFLTITDGGAAKDVLVANYNGKVGIGTSAPTSAYAQPSLHIHATGNGAELHLTDGTTGATATDGMSVFQYANDGYIHMRENGSLRTFVNGAERMRIDSSGLVGIGTSSPVSKLNTVLVQADNASASDTTLANSFHHLGGGEYGIGRYYLTTYGYSAAQTNSGAYIGALSMSSTGSAKYDLVFGTRSVTTDTAPTERMRIDSSGSVGIGIADGDGTLHVHTASAGTVAASSQADDLVIENSTEGGMTIITPDNQSARIRFTSPSTTADVGGASIFYRQNINKMSMGTEVAGGILALKSGAGSEGLLLDASGNLLVGASGQLSAAKVLVSFDGTSHNGIVLKTTRAATGSSFEVYLNSSNQVAGSISHNGSTTVSYNTSSDQRLKENIADADDAGSKIDAIQVRKFDWKADGSHQDYGMVAQELQAVAPEAVSAPEDPEEMMGVDYSKLVPMMLKEIQSLRARIAALES